MASRGVGDLENGMATEDGKNRMEACLGFLDPIQCISGVAESQCPWTVWLASVQFPPTQLAPNGPLVTVLIGKVMCWLGWGHCFFFTHRWPLGSFLLVAQLCYSCSLDTASLHGGCKSFFISMELPNLLLFQRDKSENKPEYINW